MRRALTLVALWSMAAACLAAEPRLLVDEPGFGLELIAREPDIVTPIALAFDAKGRLLVIESHTHQRPDGYEGPKGDRIRMLADSDRDGRLDQWSTFAEGYQQAMGLCVRPDGAVYLVTRRDVRLLEDTDDDGQSDKETQILHLETTGEYPHNGMSGIAFESAGGDSGGTLYLGIGENSGVPYTLVGSDGSTFEMRDGAGNVFCCHADGSGMRRYATGFWNPFALCLAGHEQLFCVDNDPDASPPCRLIHVLWAGDYGFRYQYGRAGVHPMLAWNGELPGTLPMVCGTGEAPTALLHHRGSLWVTSWGDHRIERYGASIQRGPARTRSATLDVIVQGDEDFRPTGAAVAPDGSIYFADWVNRSYPVHGSGRIWRLSVPRDEPALADVADDGRIPWHEWGSRDDVRQFEIFAGKQIGGASWDDSDDPQLRVAALQRARWNEFPNSIVRLRTALGDAAPDVRLYAVRWIADERITDLRDEVAALLDGDIPNERYFLCVLAAIEWLDGDSSMRDAEISNRLLLAELENESRSPELHALALRLISPDHEWLTVDRLRGYLASDSPALRFEAVRTLAMQTKPERLALLAKIAGDEQQDDELRAEAVAGLASAVDDHAALLVQLANDDDGPVAREAQRVLRLSRRRQPPPDADRPDPADLEAWTALLADGGDPDAGRRLFFMPGVGPQCAACHQHGGRGGRVGPDLTRLGQQQNRERIIASILQPSREIAPHYQAWTLLTTDGLSRLALRLPKGGDDGIERYADPQGREFTLRSEEIELRSPSELSIMPEGLEQSLSIDDLRDLAAFLAATQ